MSEAQEEQIEKKITDYVKDVFKYADENLKSMTLSEKMSLVEMNDQKKWQEFKLGLRKSGYII